jgi:hypothetical protein
VKQNGYFTVEAALILPIVLWVFLFLIYQMLFQYDRCLLEQNTGMVALRGSVMPQEQTDLLTTLQKEYESINQNKYVMFRQEEPHFTVNGDTLTVETGGYFSASLPPIIYPQTTASLWRAEVTFKNNRINPVLFIRSCQKAIDAWNSF